MNRFVGFVLVASALLALWPLSAAAQVDTERFKPAVTHDGFVNAEGSAVRPTEDPWELGAFLNYQRNSLVSVDANGDLANQFVSGRMGVDLFGSVTLADPFAVGLGLPLYVLQTGDADPSFGGLGDMRIVPKLRLLDDRDTIGLALLAELRVPTHTGDFSGGARNVTFIPKVALDHRFLGGIRIGFNVGAAIREQATFANVEAGSELLYAAALGYRFGGISGKTEIGAELNGAFGLSAADKEELPLEALFYLLHDPTHEWTILGGPGIGLIPGYGVPIFRVFAGVIYRPTAHDRDGDGVPDDRDECPDVPEDFDGFEDHDGCPEEDRDTDQDGVPDKDDKCPDAKETINGFEDEDGCPDSGDPRVIYEDGQFKILDRVHFESGSATISEDSYSLLDQVALTVKANPDVERVRIEGHTDSRGDAGMNRRLSQARAESVRRYLIDKGVSPRRLKAVGHGEDKPLVQGEGDDANAKNRRVEFFVESGGGE
jgi:OmpA-OmpF porin, OOP family